MAGQGLAWLGAAGLGKDKGRGAAGRSTAGRGKAWAWIKENLNGRFSHQNEVIMDELKKFPEWKQAVEDAVKQFNYGDTIEHDWLYENFDMKPPETGTAESFKEFQFKFLSYVEGFKSLMLESHQMFLVSSRGIGYLIVHPEKQTSVSWKILKRKVTKELDRASNSLINIRTEMLSKATLNDNTLKQSTVAALRAANMEVFSGKNKKQDLDVHYGSEVNVPKPRISGDGVGQAAEA